MPHPLGLRPSKIIAVHLNYRSRALQRGRIPPDASYFFKPPSGLSWSGQPLVRPQESSLLGAEGEIAVLIGKPTRGVTVEQAWSHIAGYLPANDAGLYDLRGPDRGSNVRSKGGDGFSPVGAELLTDVDPADLLLQTLVNGEVVQEARSDDLIFSFGQLVADLSRLMTLEAGDLILAGTPADPPLLSPGDVVEVRLAGVAPVVNTVVEAAEPLATWGAMPKAGKAERDAAGVLDPPTLTAESRDMLAAVSTATLSSQLRKRGLQHTFLEGLRPARPDLRMIGVARTLRYVALREDVFDRMGGGMNAQKRAVEALGDGDVLVIEARGEAGAGTIGDILALRAQVRGAVGIVTDGCLRDSPTFADLDIPTYSAGAHAAVLGRRHVPYETDVAISCGGVLVLPGDVLVGDGEGVIVIPAGIVAEVATAALEQEREEAWIHDRVAAGASVDGLYPMNATWRERYEQS